MATTQWCPPRNLRHISPPDPVVPNMPSNSPFLSILNIGIFQERGEDGTRIHTLCLPQNCSWRQSGRQGASGWGICARILILSCCEGEWQSKCLSNWWKSYGWGNGDQNFLTLSVGRPWLRLHGDVILLEDGNVQWHPLMTYASVTDGQEQTWEA